PVEFFGAGLCGMLLLLMVMAVAPALLPKIFDADSKAMVAIAQGGDDIRNLSFIAMIAAVVLLVTYIQGQKRHLILACILIAATIVQEGDQVAAHYNKDSMKKIS